MPDDGVEVVTFGCRLNGVESDAMAREARAAGHRQLTVVNSCAVTAEAVRQSRQAIRKARRLRPGARIVVTGCAAETETVRFRSMPEVDVVMPNAAKTLRTTWQALEPGLTVPSREPDRAAPTHTRGFVEIQNGCDHRCTFCIIPYGRGASRSQSADAVVARICALVEAGAREVVLTGVDVTAYAGAGGEPALGALVRTILAAVPHLPRLRLSSLDCVEIDPVLMDCIAGEPRLMPHLHLSIQSGSDLILKRMKRRHSRTDVKAVCAAVRSRRSDIVFGADFIAGFPTESETAFAETLDLIEECGLTHIHAFPYSARPGTPAARMPPVAAEIVRTRAAHLRAAGDARLRLHLERQLGRRLTVLSERDGRGYAEDFTRVRLPPETAPGLIVPLIAASHDGRMMTATTPSQGLGNAAAE
jgi:threonylcarbamoyladenosine tRNA methylthiotransferase MtaB